MMWADVILSTLQSCPGAQTFVHQSLPLPQNKVLNMMTWHAHVDWLNPGFGWASWHQLNHPPFSLICLKFVISWKQAKIPNPCELPNHPGTQTVYMPDMASGGEHLWSRSPACRAQATSCFHLTSSLTNSIPNSSWTKRRRRNATTSNQHLKDLLIPKTAPLARVIHNKWDITQQYTLAHQFQNSLFGS